LQNQELGIPPDTNQQVRARNILTDRTSAEFNKMKKELPIGRSTSNFLLQAITSEKRNAQLSRIDLTKMLD
jgi:hypothetical protein